MTVTVTPSTSDVADKAVSTDDGGSGGMEVARLEAVLAALVETKVEAMKASSTLSRRSGSAPASPRRPRLTSTSTASSSLNHHYHHHHHHHHHRHSQQQQQQQQQQQHNKKKGQHYQQHHRHRRRRHDSAPCGSDYFNNVTDHSQHKLANGRGRRRASESPRSPRKKRRHSRSPNVLQGVVQDVHAGLDSRFELLGIDGDQDVALINFERAKDILGDSCEYPRLHRSACYFSQSAAQLKIHYDDDDYVALNVADELEEEEILSGPEKMDESQGRYHRPRRKRKRKRRKIESVGPEEELVDPEELPPRARWTIVATACLLLAMSLLLVGVTLRMAPIIDDMVRKENEELLNSLNRDISVPENVTAPP
ncbi:lateral signaling target protein 2 homolog [Pogonomyrmex barbatus]|uniref:Lateral signaling target protein 2 homolog n=1 Tax=Pogonomyrmex barbatus TaxID=144034 RepID=A0A6I9WCZ3_9HYME|nr:lateral signaling target protein 2 homolog [Pogonomyrmex barbatus]XP_011640122.1 lateral signaling target protein 2 homolog [Pogonomyrmex barbatus]XP_011640123.1 lateral signaling target protein 2 homolog [Pogonomyrmex barbatus]XP_011640124.1 lateral signaling target protein 2 homolog [Pogonomyrmex barbatus]